MMLRQFVFLAGMLLLSSISMAGKFCDKDNKLFKHEIDLGNYEQKVIKSPKRWGIEKTHSSVSNMLITPDHPYYGKNIKETVYCDKRYNFNKCDDYSVWYTKDELISYESNGSEIFCSSTSQSITNFKGVTSYKQTLYYYTKLKY